MKGLLYKEWMTLWRIGRLYLAILLVAAVVPLGRGYGAAFVGMLPFSLIQMDEQAKWGRLSVAMPYSSLQLVLPKYLLSWGLALILALLSAISLAVIDAPLPGALAQGLFLLAAVSLLSAVICPLAFRFGTQRGRLFFILLVVLFAIAISGGGSEISAALDARPGLGGLLLLAAVPVNALSVYLSQRWYRRGARA